MRNATAHARAGRTPEPTAFRRDRADDAATFVRLPRQGRKGKAPAFPLDVPSPLELTIWADLWALPQAVAWEQGRYLRTVAHYVRASARAETSEVASFSTLARQYEDSLGLTEAGMRSNRWVMDEEPTVDASSPAPRTTSAKTRFRSIEGGAA